MILNKKGVTLVEVMIALVVLLIVFMGLVQASLVSINSNTRNVLRDEAVRITSDVLTRIRASAYDDLDRNPGTDPDYPAAFPAADLVITRTFRNVNINYDIDVVINILDAQHKQITITTRWSWQGEPFRHDIMTTRRVT